MTAEELQEERAVIAADLRLGADAPLSAIREAIAELSRRAEVVESDRDAEIESAKSEAYARGRARQRELDEEG